MVLGKKGKNMSAELIHQMYIAYYQRPADPAGLIYWQDQLKLTEGEKPAGMLSPQLANAPSHPRFTGIKLRPKDFSNLFGPLNVQLGWRGRYWEASGFTAAKLVLLL